MRTLISFLFLSSIALSSAATADSNDELSQQFVQLLRYEEHFKESRDACAKTARTVTPESLYNAEPNRFGGISPNSKYWPQIIEAYEAYYINACSRPSKDEFIQSLADAYKEKLSESELRQAINFYSSPIGQELVSAHKLASKNAVDLITKSMAQQIPPSAAELDHHILELIDLHNSKPLKNAF